MKSSVLIPCYNSEDVCKDTIKSLLNFDEILCCDDCSSDQTRSILAENSKVVVLSSFPEKVGSNRLRERLFSESTGDYIKFFDCDDIAIPEALGHQVAYLEDHPDVDACFGLNILMSKNPHTGDFRFVEPKEKWLQSKNPLEVLISGGFQTGAMLYRRSSLKEFKEKRGFIWDPKIDLQQDQYVFLDFVAQGYKVDRVPNLITHHYRWWRTEQKSREDRIKSCQSRLGFLEKAEFLFPELQWLIDIKKNQVKRTISEYSFADSI